jgi:hypothetical protein
MKKIVFYHVYLDGNFKLIIQEQLFKLFASGLYKECDSIQLHVSTPDETRIPWLVNLVSKYNKIITTVIKIDKGNYPPDYRESKITLMNLKKMADQEDALFCYFHSKGVSNHGYLIDLWRISCDYATVWEWKKNVNMLNDGYDAVGPNLRYDTFLGRFPHFSGCYWWSKSEYLRTLDFSYLTDVTNKYLEEFWIGSNANGKLCSTFECGHNEPYLIETTLDKYITAN